MTLFDLFDYLTAKWMLPLGGLFTVLFTGWYLDRKIVWEEITNYGTLRFYGFRIFMFILKFIAPLGIFLIFLDQVGVFRWF